ncbi:hypothetical protein BDK51DRAFT_49851 [Blyttiomyces helicus]|uniref:Uncharacterized protein n=1 Tax=Blyttiomyces helicus TaxID=388810 RepID=A0A4P9W628_9FUNG|nr:hypothetical protein BDK51DRAFT_49851 [Blyttiomyces helicus]|eukprot:RKO87899.1 hypothetical protein BDK51DRAFT_49851 [Blyttiomyces helicus]
MPADGPNGFVLDGIALICSCVRTLTPASPSAFPSTAIPYLTECVFLAIDIAQAVDTMKSNRHSCVRIIERANRIMKTVDSLASQELDRMEQDGKEPKIEDIQLPTHIMAHLLTLVEVLQETEEFVKSQINQRFIQRFLNRDAIESTLAGLHSQLQVISADLQLALAVDAKSWREQDRLDRDEDLAELEVTLKTLLENDYKILNALELKQQEYMEAMEVRFGGRSVAWRN